MKANVGDYIKSSVRNTKGVREQRPLQVVRIDGDPDSNHAGYELEDGTVIGDWEISADDVLLESEVTH